MIVARGIAGTLAAVALVAAGCDRSPSAVGDALTPDEARAVAAAYATVGMGALGGGAGPAFSLQDDPGGGTAQFAFTHPCPRGGRTRVEGTSTVSYAQTPGSGTLALAATRTEEGCAVPIRGGRGTLTLDGNPAMELTASQTWADWQPGDATATQKGSFRWTRSGGGSGTCDVDVTTTLSRATMRITVQGRFCGHDVSFTGGA